MFTPEERHRLGTELLEFAARDSRISGAAITGSAAANREDRWSDIDLAFGVTSAAQLPSALDDWTAYMYQQHRALHHLDVTFGAWIYRVFLLANTLQVDLAFVPAAEFRALTPAFRLHRGESQEPASMPPPQPEAVIGYGWLYALHARSCIARGKLWQAAYMINNLRDNVLALACLRHDLPAVQGRGFDLLPKEVLAHFDHSLIQHLDVAEISRVFASLMPEFLLEIEKADAALAVKLRNALLALPRLEK